MSWEEMVQKENSPILEKVDGKTRKRIKKLLQSNQPTTYMGQEFTQLGDLISELKSKGLIKSGKLSKKLEKMEEKNLDIVASASELRKDYETLYRQVKGIIYPKSKGSLGEEKDEWREFGEPNATTHERVSR